MWGIDVSRHQGMINWATVVQQGVQFVILKAMNEKTHQPDPRFEFNYEHSGNYKLHRGVYLYMIAQNEADAMREADALLKILHGRKLERNVWLDVEDSRIKDLGKDKLTRIIDIEASMLRSGGYQVGIYSNLDWYNNVLDGSALNERYDWWLARYPKKDDGSIKLLLTPDKSMSIWQYSSKGSIDGIKGPVDMDIDISDLGKTDDQIASEILVGKWGNGQIRYNRLTAAGYDFALIQQIVTKRVHDAKYYPKYEGFSLKIDEVFKAIGVEEKYRGNKVNRAPIAKANKIEKYSGTLLQNLKLISLAKEGNLKRP